MIERAVNEFLLYKADEFSDEINAPYTNKKFHKFNKKR